jgi:hypothetical protein
LSSVIKGEERKRKNVKKNILKRNEYLQDQMLWRLDCLNIGLDLHVQGSWSETKGIIEEYKAFPFPKF